MTPLIPYPVLGSDLGLQLNVKPVMLPDKAFSRLENAYVYRERVLKREGIKTLGRLRRVFIGENFGLTGAGVENIQLHNIFSGLGTLPSEMPELVPGSLIVTIDAPDTSTFIDNGNGTLTATGLGLSAGSYVNYLLGDINLNFSAPLTGGATITLDVNYYPSLPAMGINTRDIVNINDEETIFFDTIYAYKFLGTGFQEYIPGTTWTGTDSDFFWTTNYRSLGASSRIYFATNFNLTGSTYDPIRYTDGNTWTDFQPIIADNPPSAAQNLLYQAKILIPYYGRLLALNTWEGTTAGTYTAASNFFARCRFSALGDPTATDAWRVDLFGKGGFIDAPTNESIIGAYFYKNTLIVTFERSTWQLRYVGEYGVPFIWERISSDFGSESKMSGILFDDGVRYVGDKAIVRSTGVNVERIDQQIPDIVFSFRNASEGVERVHGIRDFQRQLVFWSYSDSNLGRKYPNKVLLYNYINDTYAIFRDNVTCFGTFQPNDNITWDRLDVFWDDDQVLWDDIDNQSQFPYIVCGNQQGFIHYYGYTTINDPSLSIVGVNLSNPVQLTINDHNLETGEIIYLTGLNFVDSNLLHVDTNLNNRIFQVNRIDDDNITLYEWDGQNYINNYSVTPISGTASYIGGGQLILFPKMTIQTKDFNPFVKKGQQVRISYIDFLTDVPGNPNAQMTVNLILNSSQTVISNILVGNKNVEQYLPANFYLPLSEYAWHRFFATTFGQYIRIEMTYNDDLMNTFETHTSGWTLNGYIMHLKPGGKINF